MAFDNQFVRDDHVRKAPAPMYCCQRNVIDAAVNRPPVLMFMSGKTHQYHTVSREHVSYLPTIVHVGVFLAHRWEGNIPTFARPLRRRVMQFFMTKHDLDFAGIVSQVLCQPCLLYTINEIAPNNAVVARLWCRPVSFIVSIQNN